MNLNDPNDKARHDALVTLVEQMLALKQRLASETFVFNDTRHELEESIARVDAQIDRAVYALYGLDAEDIRIIEGL